MRAKFKVVSVDHREGFQLLRMEAVYVEPGESGPSPDNTFSTGAPGGELQMTVTAPDMLGTFKPGAKFYLDLTPVA